MQKNIFSCAFGVLALSLLCSCGNGKKDEVKVDTKEQAPVEQKAAEANKEVAQAEQQPATDVATEESKAVAQNAENTQNPAPTEQEKAATENKVA